MKDAEHGKDKAIWVQRCELADKAAAEMESQMDKQKAYYTTIITTLNNGGDLSKIGIDHADRAA